MSGELDPMRDALDNPVEAPAFAQPGDALPDPDRYDRPPFPLDGPVRCLGISSGIDGTQRCYYLNFNGQLTGLDAGNRHGKNSLIALYGPKSDFLEAHWPQWSAPQYEGRGAARTLVRESQIVGFDQADASRAHIEECVRKGVFDPFGRMRGRGAHKLGQTGGMALHCGDAVMISELRADGAIKGWRWHEPGLHDRMVYTAAEPIPRPWHDRADTRAAEKLLGLLFTWHWKRELLDARFVLGMIGASLIGGALPWRPHVWITGGAGTGKSTLNGKDGVIHRVLGEGVFRTTNTSAAAIRQRLKNSTVPVMLDEREAEKDNHRNAEILELMRVASSGDSITRGGADHNALDFTLESCFWLSSVLIPPMDPTDRSRVAICELNPLAEDARPLDLDSINFAEIGRRLLRRMIDGWPRLRATKAKFHDALASVGHVARACDQFGTLLACADLLLNDWDTADGLPDDEEVADWAGRCRPQRLAEVNETTPEHIACLNHITTYLQQARGGDEREMIGTWIGQALAHVVMPLLPEDALREAKAGARLQQIGLKLVKARYYAGETDVAGKVTKPARWGASAFDDRDAPCFLAVAREHQGLARIFDNTKWQAGVWYQALKRNADAREGVKVKFGKVSLTAVLVPLAAAIDEEELPEASRAEAVAEWIRAQVKGAGA